MSGAPRDAGESVRVLDQNALARLQELDPSGRNRLVERVLQAFVSSSKRLMGELAPIGGSQELRTIRHIAHTLKSSSASIGAAQLSQICADIEISIRNDRTDDLDSRLASMKAELAVVLQALKPMLEPMT